MPHQAKKRHNQTTSARKKNQSIFMSTRRYLHRGKKALGPTRPAVKREGGFAAKPIFKTMLKKIFSSYNNVIDISNVHLNPFVGMES